ncbi:MAG: GyrI-like domain-containing protein [Bacteroidota bacterium]
MMANTDTLNPRILTLKEKKLLGMSLKMSLVQNRTGELWSGFMPLRTTISDTVSEDKFSLQEYPVDYFRQFSPNNEFVKWAAVEVSSYDNAPDKLERFILPGGLYAVFDYKGLSSDTSIFQKIFSQWLPASEYDLDHRPHFEVLGSKYRNNDPDSEEEIWIPIQSRE